MLRREPRRGALVMALSAAYFVLVTAVLMPALGGGADVGRFEGLAVDGFSGFAGVAMTLFGSRSAPGRMATNPQVEIIPPAS